MILFPLAVRVQVFKSTVVNGTVESDSEHPVKNYLRRYRDITYIINSGSSMCTSVVFNA
jgi:hypothetical protein